MCNDQVRVLGSSRTELRATECAAYRAVHFKATAAQCTRSSSGAGASCPAASWGAFACGSGTHSARVATGSDRSRVYELNTLTSPDACVSGSARAFSSARRSRHRCDDQAASARRSSVDHAAVKLPWTGSARARTNSKARSKKITLAPPCCSTAPAAQANPLRINKSRIRFLAPDSVRLSSEPHHDVDNEW